LKTLKNLQSKLKFRRGRIFIQFEKLKTCDDYQRNNRRRKSGRSVSLNRAFWSLYSDWSCSQPDYENEWEGTGVEPNTKVPKKQALKTAYLLALNKSTEKTKDEDLKNALKRTIGQTQKELDKLKAKK